MDRYCIRCGRVGSIPLHRHHLIAGNGRRKACETEESVIDLCYECHTFIHSGKGSEYWKKLKLELQKKYFAKGYSEDEVRKLMGGKIYL